VTIRTIEAADQAGLHSAWLSEDPDGWDAFTVLGAAALRTERIRLGTGVTNPYLRHPVLLAMSVATLDRLSGGRAFLGLGRGQLEWYRHGLGIETGRPLAALEETMVLLRQWWRLPHRASVEGHFHVNEWRLALAPIQPFVPIYLAALGPRALRLAAQKADGVLLADFASEPFLRRFVPELLRQVGEAGRDATTFPIFVRTAVTVTDDPEPILERRKNLFALLCTLPGMARQVEVPGFDLPELVARLREVMRTEEVLARGGGLALARDISDLATARRLIPTDLVAAVSYVGPASELRARLRRLAEIGVTHVFLAPPAHPDPGEFADLIARLRP
jgi:alkanesulfonate monooxygenase SsuD/methylene tetrahydromethanopterin reductase-like flavin-dependent oxidoreductase (luciferase family)